MRRLQFPKLMGALGALTLASVPALAQTPTPKPVQSGTPKPATAPAKPADTTKAEPAKKPAGTPIAIGAEVDGALQLADLDGKMHALKDYRGKTTVIALWALDSPACKQYQERLKKLNDDYSAKGVTFVVVDPSSIDVDMSSPEPYKRLKEQAGKSGIAIPLMVDKGQVVTERLGGSVTPEVFVIDAKGMLRYRGAIDDDPKSEKADKAIPHLRNALDAVMAGKDVATPSTTATGTPFRHEAAKKPEEPPKKPDAPKSGEPTRKKN